MKLIRWAKRTYLGRGHGDLGKSCDPVEPALDAERDGRESDIETNDEFTG